MRRRNAVILVVVIMLSLSAVAGVSVYMAGSLALPPISDIPGVCATECFGNQTHINCATIWMPPNVSCSEVVNTTEVRSGWYSPWEINCTLKAECEHIDDGNISYLCYVGCLNENIDEDFVEIMEKCCRVFTKGLNISDTINTT